jgi:putative exporter of polyketide antibiotics
MCKTIVWWCTLLLTITDIQVSSISALCHDRKAKQMPLYVQKNVLFQVMYSRNLPDYDRFDTLFGGVIFQ